MANEIDNNIGDDSVQQDNAPVEQQTEQTQQTPQNPEDELLPLEDDEEPELWGDDDEDEEPPVNPLEIEDDESKFIDEEGKEEPPLESEEDEDVEESEENPLPQKAEPVKEQPQIPLTDDEQYARNNIDPSFIPGTDEFFEAVENDAKAAVEKSLGEEFDEFNPKHTARYQYFLSQCSRSREAEMERGIKWCKARDERIAQQQKAQKIQKDFGDFLNSQITTQEQMQKFQDACDNLTVKQTREINAMIEKGDYGAVQNIINRIKGGNTGYRQPRYASQNPRPVRQSSNNGNNALRLSDVL